MSSKSKHKDEYDKSTAPSSLRMGVLITVLVLIVLIAAVLMVPAFRVTEVYCEGTSRLKAEDVISSSQITTGKNIFLVNIGKAERNIEKTPLVGEVSVRRVFPNKICISVKERVPSAYMMNGSECIVIDVNGVIVEVINDDRAGKIAEEYTPKGESDTAEEETRTKETDDTGIDESTETESDEEAEETESEDSADGTEGEPTAEEKFVRPYESPLVTGIEITKAELGKEITVSDEDKFGRVLGVFDALIDAQLLSRATYIDFTNMSDIRIVVENRLDIFIGGTENIDYRTQFLAEVINTKISDYEKAVMDYRGDDIYVRPPEDGKDRIIEAEDDEDSGDSEESSSEDDTTDDERTSEEDTSESGEDEAEEDSDDGEDSRQSMSMDE